MNRDIKWEYWKVTNPEETMKIFRTMNEQDLVSGIEEVIEQYKTPTSEPEDPLPVHVIIYKG